MGIFGPEVFSTKDGRTLTLRNCLPEDARYFAAFQQTAAQETRFTLQVVGQVPDLEKTRENWRQCIQDPMQLRIGVFDGSKIAAQLGFKPLLPAHPWTAHVGQFGMIVLKDYWGHGIARRMLEVMDQHAQSVGITRIEATVRARNDRGVALYQKSGYRIEGLRQSAAWIENEYWDEYFIAKLLPSHREMKSESFSKIIGVDHAQITIPKGTEAEARTFYCAFLGLLEIEKPENRKKNGGFWLQVGATQIHVGVEEGVDRTATKAHVAYRVGDLGLWRKRLLEKNIELTESQPFPHAEAFEFRDPFGNRVELIQFQSGAKLR